MTVKSKVKSNSEKKTITKKTKPVVKAGAATKEKPVVKKAAVKKAVEKTASKATGIAKAGKGSVKAKKYSESEKPTEVRHAVNLARQTRQTAKPALRKTALGNVNANLFNFMKAPRHEYAFDVGDAVEVFCDHEKGRERIRGWIKGIVVQVDNKMVAVQFRSNVFLTDGWMVPDRILWYPLNSEHIRPATTGRKPTLKKDIIPDY
ncbi:hypothetical protein MASR2M66_16380 [Chloroflexota bacterium]